MESGPWAGKTAEEIETEIHKAHTILDPFEEQWRNRQPYLQSRGYSLRPRYHPGWVASWQLDPTLNPTRCEDYIEAPVRYHRPQLISRLTRQLQVRPSLMDATRTSDNSLVYIKYLPTHSDELRIALMLSSEDLQTNPKIIVSLSWIILRTIGIAACRIW